jgi:integrase
VPAALNLEKPMAKKLYRNGRRVDANGDLLRPTHGYRNPIEKNRYPGIEVRTNHKTGKVSYRAHFHRKGQDAKVKTWPTEQEAIDWLALMNLAHRERGQAPSHERLKSVILRTAIEEYIAYELKPNKLPAEKRLADRIKSDHWVLKKFKDNQICNCNIADWNIDGLSKIAKYVDFRRLERNTEWYYNTEREIQPDNGVLFSTIRREFNLLQRVFKVIGKTYHPGLINHFSGYDLPYPKDDDKNKSVNERTRVLQHGELLRIETACIEHCSQGTLDETLAVIYLAIETGMRMAEIFNIKWVDIHKEHRTLHIPVAKRGPRTICMSFLVNYIIERVFGNREEKFVIPRKGRNDPQGAFEERWQNVVRHSGLVDFEFRDLRRTSRLRFYAATLNDLQSAIMLGHRHPLITNRTYLSKGDPIVMDPIQELLDKDIFGERIDGKIDKSYMYGRMIEKGYGAWMMNGLQFSNEDKEKYHKSVGYKLKYTMTNPDGDSVVMWSGNKRPKKDVYSEIMNQIKS